MEEGKGKGLHLLQGLVVDKASSIFRDLQLAFLDLLAKLPVMAGRSAWECSCGRCEGNNMRLSAEEHGARAGRRRGTYIMRYLLPPSPEGLGTRGEEDVEGGSQSSR
jgi:hypothetical protein